MKSDIKANSFMIPWMVAPVSSVVIAFLIGKIVF